MIKKCGWFVFSILFLFSISFAVPVFVHADSGWDSDYGGGSDYGGSDWGGSSSSWDGGSSWDFDYDYKNDNSTFGKEEANAFLAFFLIIFLIVVISSILAIAQKSSIKTAHKEMDRSNMHDEDSLVQKFFSNYTEESLLELLAGKFIDVQEAWMNFDYPELEKLCTKELYESYKSDLEILHKKGQKNVMYDYHSEAMDLEDIKEENGLIIVSIYLHISFYDYVVDSKTAGIVRGQNKKPLHNQYHLEYVVSKDLDKCPNCGAQIKDEKKCPYCASPISNHYHDFVLSKKSRIM